MVKLLFVEEVNPAGGKVTVSTSDGEFPTLSNVKKGDSVLVIPAGALVPAHTAKLMKIHQMFADKEGDHAYLVHTDVAVKAKDVFPASPYKDGTRDRYDMTQQGGDYSYPLGVSYVDDLVDEGDDAFSLDEDDTLNSVLVKDETGN